MSEKLNSIQIKHVHDLRSILELSVTAIENMMISNLYQKELLIISKIFKIKETQLYIFFH